MCSRGDGSDGGYGGAGFVRTGDPARGRRAGDRADRLGRTRSGGTGDVCAGGVPAGESAVWAIPDDGASAASIRSDKGAGRGGTALARRGRHADDGAEPALDRRERE